MASTDSINSSLALCLLFFTTTSLLISAAHAYDHNSPGPAPHAYDHNSPGPAPSDLSPSPARNDVATAPSHPASPAPATPENIKHEDNVAADLDSTAATKDEKGMSAGQKAGVALGVIAGACVVAACALVYRRRQQNIRRSQFGYAAGIELL